MRLSNCVRRPVNARGRRGFSLIELLIVIAIILVIITAAVPQYNKAIMSSHETAAIRTLQTIYAMQTQYYSQFNRYAQSLTELGPPASGAEGPAAAGLIAKDLADGKKSGYVFAVQGSQGGWSATAIPESFGSSGRRTFFIDQTNQIHQNWSQEPANANSPSL